MKKMDLGEGVTLSATWILPIAVVPRPLRMKGAEKLDGDSLPSVDDEAMMSEKGDGMTKEVEASKEPSEQAVRKPNKLRRILSRTKK